MDLQHALLMLALAILGVFKGAAIAGAAYVVTQLMKWVTKVAIPDWPAYASQLVAAIISLIGNFLLGQGLPAFVYGPWLNLLSTMLTTAFTTYGALFLHDLLNILGGIVLTKKALRKAA